MEKTASQQPMVLTEDPELDRHLRELRRASDIHDAPSMAVAAAAASPDESLYDVEGNEHPRLIPIEVSPKLP